MYSAARRWTIRAVTTAFVLVGSLVATTNAHAQIDPGDMVSGHVEIPAGPGPLVLYTVPSGMLFVLTDFSWAPEEVGSIALPPPPPFIEVAWDAILRLGDSSGDRWRGFGFHRVFLAFDDANPQGQHAGAAEDHHWPVEAHFTTGLVFESDEDVILDTVVSGGGFTSGASWSGYLSPMSTSAVDPADPRDIPLLGAVPNPSGTDARLDFTLEQSQTIVLAIFDVTGRRVRELHDGLLRAGAHSLLWDGTDDLGQPVSSGTYFALLQTEGTTSVEKLLRVQ